ncbi:MAG: hypothetical protein SGJ05_07945 [bacterium]|nr:hypothetical protein [bacterium]
MKAIILSIVLAAIGYCETTAFGLLEKIGIGRQVAVSSSLSTYIRGRYARTVLSDTFGGFVSARNLYGACVPRHAVVTVVRVQVAGVWKQMKIGESTSMWSAGRESGTDNQKKLFKWMKDYRRDYFIFEFSSLVSGQKVIVETTYEEVIPMFGNKWTYQVPFPWLVGSDDCPVSSWSVDVETDENFSQPLFTPVMPGINIEGRKMTGVVANAVPSPFNNPVIECLEHPDHRNSTVRDIYGTQKHLGVFVSPVDTEGSTRRRTISIVMQPGVAGATTGDVQARLLIDALLSRIRPQDLVNVWSNTATPQSLWKKPQRAHDDNVYAVLNLIDNLSVSSAASSYNKILDSIVAHDNSDTADHVIVIVTGASSISADDLAKLPASISTNVVLLANALQASPIQSLCWLRGGTYQHVAEWYGWRRKIAPVADSCLGVALNTVGGTASNALSPEPPGETALMHGSRRPVYAYDDDRQAKNVQQDFQGVIARTWANERIDRLTLILLAGVSEPIAIEMQSEIRRIGTTYQIWSPYNPVVE